METKHKEVIINETPKFMMPKINPILEPNNVTMLPYSEIGFTYLNFDSHHPVHQMLGIVCFIGVN